MHSVTYLATTTLCLGLICAGCDNQEFKKHDLAMPLDSKGNSLGEAIIVLDVEEASGILGESVVRHSELGGVIGFSAGERTSYGNFCSYHRKLTDDEVQAVLRRGCSRCGARWRRVEHVAGCCRPWNQIAGNTVLHQSLISARNESIEPEESRVRLFGESIPRSSGESLTRQEIRESKNDPNGFTREERRQVDTFFAKRGYYR